MKNEINQLLLKKWDPIGVAKMPEAKDEYLQYVNKVYQIIQQSTSYMNLFEFLWEIETEHMGLKGNRNKTEEFAKALFRLVKERIGS